MYRLVSDHSHWVTFDALPVAPGTERLRVHHRDVLLVLGAVPRECDASDMFFAILHRGRVRYVQDWVLKHGTFERVGGRE